MLGPGVGQLRGTCPELDAVIFWAGRSLSLSPSLAAPAQMIMTTLQSSTCPPSLPALTPDRDAFDHLLDLMFGTEGDAMFWDAEAQATAMACSHSDAASSCGDSCETESTHSSVGPAEVSPPPSPTPRKIRRSRAKGSKKKSCCESCNK
jgi:hypothetical protein